MSNNINIFPKQVPPSVAELLAQRIVLVHDKHVKYNISHIIQSIIKVSSSVDPLIILVLLLFLLMLKIVDIYSVVESVGEHESCRIRSSMVLFCFEHLSLSWLITFSYSVIMQIFISLILLFVVSLCSSNMCLSSEFSIFSLCKSALVADEDDDSLSICLL